jgi:DNA polymerase I
MGFHAVLGWPRPVRVLDLYAEFCAVWNGLTTKYENKRSLVAALVQYGLGGLDAATKDDMRACVLRGGPWDPAEKSNILDYCMSDVDALEQLLPAMLPGIIPERGRLERRLHYALMRGRYTACMASVEITGTPLDVPLLRRFNRQRHRILADMIEEVDPAFRVFENGSFKEHLFEEMLRKRDISWPRTELGTLKTDAKTFRSMALEYPELEPLRELLATKQMLQRACVIDGEGTPESGANKKPRVGLVVGRDGRNRTGLRAFGTVTMRNAPSTSEYIWGWSSWARSFVQPPPGRGLVACDWSQQEIAIAARLSGDPTRMLDYQSDGIRQARGPDPAGRLEEDTLGGAQGLQGVRAGDLISAGGARSCRRPA